MPNMRVKDLKEILEKLPDDTMIVIPVVDENNVNRIDGFRLVRTAGILEDEDESEDMRRVLCLNGAADGFDLAEQVYESGRGVSVIEVLYGQSTTDDSEEEDLLAE